MRIDLFELIEGLFRGIVYFIYNVVETIATIVRHPIKGPVRLHRRYRREGGRQVGGLTFLFLSVLATYWVSIGTVILRSSRATSTELSARVSDVASRLDTNLLWPFTIAALVTTVVIDAVLRLVLRWRFPGRPARRALILASTEYSLFWLFVAVEVMFLASLGVVPITVTIGSIIAPFIAIIPPAVILMRSTRWNDPSSKRAEFAWLTAWAIGIVLLLWLAFVTSAKVLDGLITLRDARTNVLIQIETLNCRQIDGRDVEVFGLVTAGAGKPRAISPSDLRLTIDQEGVRWAEPITLTNPTWADANASRFVVLKPNDAEVIHLRFANDRMLFGDLDCRLKGDRSKFF